MKYCALLSFLLLSQCMLAQTPAQNVAVQVTAKAIESPFPQIELTWADDLFATRWNVYRLNDTGTFELLKTVQSPDTSFTDDRVTLGKRYTYLIHKEDVNNVLGFGQITAGVRSKAHHFSGKCLLIIEDSVFKALPNEVNRLGQDLSNEGWAIETVFVSSSEDHSAIKDSIKKHHAADSNIKSVLLLGNIAVPYSGYMAPDGHDAISTPNNDHQGAWACDLFYADLDGVWTDVNVDATNSPERSINRNQPGDGKFDQNHLPSDADLEVGRIYLEKFGDFEADRMVLYKRHLDRNHAYRTSALKYRSHSIINDYFPGLSEGFAGFGYRSFPSIDGPESIEVGALLDHARDSSYLMSYGCGAGYYSKVGVKLRNKQGQRIDSFSVGQTSDYFNYEIHSAFNILFGSYFGDWDSKNNVMRSTLAGQSPALASFWAGRPTWHINEFLHGAPLGTSTKNSQNSDIDLFTYIENNGWTYERMVHPALMGDPTLRIRYSNALDSAWSSASTDSTRVKIQWKTDDKKFDGYFVYRKDSASGIFRPINTVPITSDSLWDSLPYAGLNEYMVRGLSLHDGYTGSYELLSPGASTSISGIKKVFISSQTSFAQFNFSVYPNPATNRLHISTSVSTAGRYTILTSEGKEVVSGTLKGGSEPTVIPIRDIPKGVYLLEIQSKGASQMQQLVIL